MIRYCKSLFALSWPAKLFLLEKGSFLQFLKKMSHCIDNMIVVESSSNKKRTSKKQNVLSSSVMLSNSRRTVLSQSKSYLDGDDVKMIDKEERIS
jgi:hypothetical protein